jgi:6,7-dimethyl-8-ribityllumazine synthase
MEKPMSVIDMSMPALQERLNGRGLTIGIVVARYNWSITGALLQLAQEELVRLGVSADQLHIVTVPGSYELAIAARSMLADETYNGLIVFGCVMKGETRHDVVVADAAAQGIQRVALDTGVPVIFGVICANTQQQAEARIVRGIECAQAVVEMARTVQTLNEHKRAR